MQQGDRKYEEVLQYVWDRVAVKSGSSRKSRAAKPFAVHANCTEEEEGIINENNIPNCSPVLHIFLVKNKFEKGIIAADGARFAVMSNIYDTLLAFISVFTVFFVGYPDPCKQFLGFMETVFLGEDFKGTKCIGHTELLHEFNEAKKNVVKSVARMEERGSL